jgi:hypothetical protein
MGLPGKPDGISGGEVEKYYRDGHIREIAEYCESDVLNTYRVWLRYELFRGRLSEAQFEASEAGLVDFIKARGNTSRTLLISYRWRLVAYGPPFVRSPRRDTTSSTPRTSAAPGGRLLVAMRAVRGTWNSASKPAREQLR